MSLGKAIIPIDGSDVALKAAKYAIRFAERQGWEVVLLNVIEPAATTNFAGNAGISVKTNNNHRKEGMAALTEAKELFDGTDIQVKTKLIEGSPAEVIVTEAETGNCEIIIIGSKGLGHGKIQSLFLGSVAEQIIRKSAVPVLLVKENTME